MLVIDPRITIGYPCSMADSTASESNYAKRFPKRRFLGNRDLMLIEASRNARVVHLGCTDWPNQVEQMLNNNLLHSKLCDITSACLGVDVDVEGVENLRRSMPGREFHLGDISSSSGLRQLIIDFTPDVILIPDVLEHVEDARAFLAGLKDILSRTGATAILTTPNAYALKTYLPILIGLDFTHIDHCLLHNEFTLEHVLSDVQLAIVEIGYYKRDIGPRYGSIMQALSAPLDLICRIVPRFSDGLMAKVSGNAIER